MKVGIFHTAFLGDLVLASLLIEGLFLEGHEVYLITKKLAAQFYQEDKRLKKIITVNKKSGLKKINSIFEIAQDISDLNLDMLLVPHKSITTSLIVYFAKVKEKVGYNDTALSMVYSQLRSFVKEKHECLRCLDIAPESLISNKIKENLLKLSRPVLKESNNLVVFIEKNPKFLHNKQEFFIVSPGSVWATKKYPAKHFAKLIEEILNLNKNLFCILAGGKQDYDDVQNVLSNIENKLLLTRVLETASYLPLQEFTNLVAKSAFVIANDSSPVHIASGFNIPILSIYGPTSWTFGFYPTSEKSIYLNYKDSNNNLLPCHPCSPHGTKQCPKKHFKCMEELSPYILLQSVKKLVPQFF
ncbi:glycosyltransferase family 9 protein [Pigmentibacter sp. JX0631]|uniref:glycosyltransferase family 9 protein n=1 Tax=Pigmentibacter sp. JX0631 TaxID=2976982 RepID=UPI0024697796|nr:glycosyltransferase family 9 protein [Pigmentibacter sp. JX0631]WGL58490.1 glycosyltransferase family 9 protein [Pigmentibacter sp. JX0631]